MLKKITSNRTTSSFDLSIGTAMAIESIFDSITQPYDTERVISRIKDIDTYSIHYINVITLIRNLIESLNTEDKDSLYKQVNNSVTDVYETLLQEMYLLKMLYGDIKTNLIIYIPDYTTVIKGRPSLNNSTLATKSGKMLDLLDRVYSLVKTNFTKKLIEIPIIIVDHKLPRSPDKVLITTHVASDLLNVRQIPRLTLLESHTGSVKSKDKFNTKIKKFGVNDISLLPMNETIQYIFGDSILFKSVSIGAKRIVLEELRKRRVTPLTTHDYVKSVINKLGIEELKFTYKY